jgi:hypothetical protein
MSGIVAPCFSASVRISAETSPKVSPLNAMKLAFQKP